MPTMKWKRGWRLRAVAVGRHFRDAAVPVVHATLINDERDKFFSHYDKISDKGAPERIGERERLDVRA